MSFVSQAVSCGGVVIHKGKILVLYKNCRNRYEGWVLPKGTVEPGEDHETTAIREVKEESGADAEIVSYIGSSTYTFRVPGDVINKEVHWYLMISRNFYTKPQKEEFFRDAGYYKFHEAQHLLKFGNERQILEKAYAEYRRQVRKKLWGKGTEMAESDYFEDESETDAILDTEQQSV